MARMVVFLCEESGYPALEYLKESGYELPDDVSFVKVPCSGRVDIEFISQAVRDGVECVCIFGCFDDNCRYNWGNKKASYRVSRIKGILESLGISGVSVDFVPVASTSHTKLHQELWRRYKELKGGG